MIRLGIIGCADIAQKRFMPAVKTVEGIEVVAVAEEYAPQKLDAFCEEFNLEREDSFEKLIKREDIDAVYIPQPPALHYKYAKMALENDKHVLLEKPSTVEYELSKGLVELASQKGLALHENYMFRYHSQIKDIIELLNQGEIGDIRLYKASFGFPLRAQNDFRYVKSLGGGALLDAGGYTVKLATILLGETVKLDCSMLNDIEGYEVDMYGNATLSNDEGKVCQVSFGMDCQYQCNLEVWGSKGRLFTNRIFTAPEGFEPVVVIENGADRKEIKLGADTHFAHSIEAFISQINNNEYRQKMYKEILIQSEIVDQIKKQNDR